MPTTRANSLLFGVAAFLFLFTVLYRFTDPESEHLESLKTYGTSFASKVGSSLTSNGGGRGSGTLVSLGDHLDRSERQYQETLEGREWLQTEWKDPAHKIFFPKFMLFSIWDFFPASFNCPHSINRLGRPGDGGKWLCGLEKLVDLPQEQHTDPEEPSDEEAYKVLTMRPAAAKSPEPQGTEHPGCIIYSMGINVESSFEEQMLERTANCEIWGYDYSVDTFGPQLVHPDSRRRAHFTRAGIAGKTNMAASPAMLTIADLMAVNGHDHIDVLKMDIEGFEFEAMDAVIRHFLDQGKDVPISQFMVEIHLLEEFISVDGLFAWWETLEEAGFRPVWTEPNLLTATMDNLNNLPVFAEYTFINIRDKKSPFLR